MVIKFVLVVTLFAFSCLSQTYGDFSYEPDFLDMDPDSILEKNAIITANATCGSIRREYYCRLVEHADGALFYGRTGREKRQTMIYQQRPEMQQPKSYRDPSGQWVQCNYCDARDPALSHPIEYVIRGDPNMWWQSPSLAEGLQYHAVTITMDFTQVYQIVYVLLRMGDSPRPANWILERSLDGINYKPWVFFAESEYDCKRLYQPLIDGNLRVTSGPRPRDLHDEEVYCTTFYSQPQALQSGEIIVTLPLDRESTLSGPSGNDRAISKKLIEFLSARFVRLRFQKLQTLSGNWMAVPNQMDSSVYNRYYYSIRTIKVGGKCLCNSHASQCEQRVVDGIPRAICVCQHNTCGSNCEVCCPMFNQQKWRPGRICEECNCHGKADSCAFNQTVANLRLSKRRDGALEGGGVCVNCREDTTGINCESCKPGYYRPINVRPESSFPCVKCECDSSGSTGECVSNEAEVPDRYPGDCKCKEGFAGKRCDQCAEGFRRSETDPTKCVPCTCDVRGSHRGGGYKCEPPCNCKINVNAESYCRTCLSGHFNLDSTNPEGCQACYCSGLTNQCDGVSPITALTLERNGLLGIVSTFNNWKILVPSNSADSGYPVPYEEGPDDEDIRPLSADIRTVEAWLTSASLHPVDRGYYWSAPAEYLGKQLAAYRNRLTVILRFNSPLMLSLFGGDPSGRFGPNSLAVKDQLDYMWLNEPDIVLEGNGYRLAYILPATFRESHLIIDLHLHESLFRVLVEPPSSVPVNRIPISMSQGTTGNQGPYSDGGFDKVGRPATVMDMISVLSKMDRLLIKAKYMGDQSTTELLQVRLERAERDSSGRIPSMEECVCPVGHTGTSCESCAFGYWRDPKASKEETSGLTSRSMWRGLALPSKCVPCECNGHSSHCDEQTGKCIDCQHNTAGDKCDKCAPGFYGEPLSGSTTACQPCECPSLTNKKTEACVAHETAVPGEQKPYICLDCEDNTRGRYCDLCVQGYYGQPDKGISCKKCDCGRGATDCNATTGECICGFNTAGPRCEACAEGTHGDPLLGQACRPCNCHEKGSLFSTCSPGDGRCTCRAGYEGIRCERCKPGRGNVNAGCPSCQCNPIGTKPGAASTCDPITGQCSCKPGVGGTLDCSQCEPGYYNMGSNGCEKCKCSNRAVDLVCDPVSGRCKCGLNVIGDTCDKCKAGHFWNATGPDCLACDCGVGTLADGTVGQAADCNMLTGQCRCTTHVTGRQCDKCEPGFFGVSADGCKACPSCPNGQVCDQITGKCICPPNTQGDRCDECTTGSYDYNAIAGCKNCNCSAIGAQSGSDTKCDLVTGQCACKPGFTGRACDECAAGHYGYPTCKACDCDARGTLRLNGTATSNTICNQTDGSCFCKTNVQGEKCDKCKPGTFGLTIDYTLGCYSCFCFPTTSPAQCSMLTGYRSVAGREKGVEIISTDRESSPGGALIDLNLGLGTAATTDLTLGVSQFNWRFSSHRPTYLEIPELKGHLTRNYGSTIIAVSTECLPTGNCQLNSPDLSEPLAITSGVSTDMAGSLVVRNPYRIDAKMTALDGQLQLEYQPMDDAQTSLVDGFRTIWLRESDWVLTRVVGVDTRVRPTRNELMLALLNVTSFSVRLFMPSAKPKLVSVKYRVYEALSETTTASGTPIKSIEQCDCPSTSSGDHCEVASSGFFFPTVTPKPGPSILPPKPDQPKPPGWENIEWTGGVEKCRCNGMSSHCDPITGICESCTGNTMGPNCEKCAVGYMGDPTKGQTCVKCQCPSEQTDYAITCIPAPDRPYVAHQCVCKPGYSGLRCERCSPGYYGDPGSMTACQPCDCDMAGSKGSSCAQDSGQCDCWPGVLGRRCDQCQPDHVVDAGRCRDCRGDCTGELLVKADGVKDKINNLNVTSLAYQGLARLGEQAETLRKRFSPERKQKEDDLIKRTEQVAKQAGEMRETAARANATRNAIELMRCNTQTNATELNKSIKKFEDRVKEWIERIEGLSLVKPDDAVLKRWQEDARKVKSDLGKINVNTTQEWIDKLELELASLFTQAEELIKSVKPGRSIVDLERLSTYQEQQQKLLHMQTSQLYGIGNTTEKGNKALLAAQEKSSTLKKAAADAADLDVIKAFEANVTKLRDQLDATTGLPKEEIQQRLDDAKSALKDLTSMDLAELNGAYVPSSVESQYVKPIEWNAQKIVDDLRFSTKVNQTISALDSYKSIVENMAKAKDAVTEAEKAMKESITDPNQSWQETLDRVAKTGKETEALLDKQVTVVGQHNKTLNDAIERLDKIETDLDAIQQTSKKTEADSKDALNNVELINQLLADTEPEANEAARKVEQQGQKMSDLHDRLQAAENRYAQLQGTAHSTVDQANSTQTNLVKLLTESQATLKQLDSKLLRIRRLADEARSLLDVSYGALVQDPIPIRLGRGCVYSLVPYSLTKSRVFDVEFWFRLHDSQSMLNSVMMVGRRAFSGRTQMFAFTLESSNTKLRFSWNVPDGVLDLDGITTGLWYQVRVTSMWGETKMMLTERPDKDEENRKYREVITKAGAEYPEAALMLDRQMEIRIGGAIQPGTRLLSPEAWGDNGAEAFWSNLLAMDSAQFCVFDLRIGGVRMTPVDLATATSSCKQPDRLDCKLRLTYRPLIRDGYIWRTQGPLDNLTSVRRPGRNASPNYLLQRLFYYDFAGTGGYARIQHFKDLKFCEDRLQFQATPLAGAKNYPMMVLTFFDFNKDSGVTVELIDGHPKATRWTGDQLYRSRLQSEMLDAGEAFRRRVLRTTAYQPRWKRSNSGTNGEEKRSVPITQSELTIRLWRLDELLTTECHDGVIMFVGAIPPGHYAMRRRMSELGITLNSFAGRIGITNDKPSQEGGLFLEEYLNSPVGRLGDTQFSDLHQRREAMVVANLMPNSQYCLRLTPDNAKDIMEMDELQLDTAKLGSPWQPGISMTVRFNPLLTPNGDVALLRLQLISAEWLSVWLTSDYRLGLVIPGVTTKLFTKESLRFRPLNDPSFALRALELTEAAMINASLPAWKDATNSNTEQTEMNSPDVTVGEMDVTITLHFNGADSEKLDVLFDQRVVQSWSIPTQVTTGATRRVLVGPFAKFKHPLTISYLLIGNHLVDFAEELTVSENRNGVHIGSCGGGQLYPRFLERRGPVGPIWVEQGLDLAAPPGGRRLRFVDIKPVNLSTTEIDAAPVRPNGTRLRRPEDCTATPTRTAWFDQSLNSYWELSDLATLVRNK